MSQITAKLSQLRGFFIVYFAVQLVVDIVLGGDLMRESWGSGRGRWMAHLQLSRGAFFTLTLLVAGLIFALGLWLFQQLSQKKNWARIVLLVVAWLTVADALLSLLFTSGTAGFLPWLYKLAPGLDWRRAILIDRIKDFLGLLFWGYLIFVLQVNRDVKSDFFRPPIPK